MSCSSAQGCLMESKRRVILIYDIHSKITMASDVVTYYTVTTLVPTLK